MTTTKKNNVGNQPIESRSESSSTEKRRVEDRARSHDCHFAAASEWPVTVVVAFLVCARLCKAFQFLFRVVCCKWWGTFWRDHDCTASRFLVRVLPLPPTLPSPSGLYFWPLWLLLPLWLWLLVLTIHSPFLIRRVSPFSTPPLLSSFFFTGDLFGLW